nr:hypothetical protein [Oryza sativa Japonica Group]
MAAEGGGAGRRRRLRRRRAASQTAAQASAAEQGGGAGEGDGGAGRRRRLRRPKAVAPELLATAQATGGEYDLARRQGDDGITSFLARRQGDDGITFFHPHAEVCLRCLRHCADFEHTKESSTLVATMRQFDLLNEYAEEMVAYCHAGEYDHMQETIDILRQYLDDEKNEKAKICEVLDAKENELKSTIETLNQCRLECLAMKKQLEEVKFSRARLLYLTLVITVLFACLMFSGSTYAYNSIDIHEQHYWFIAALLAKYLRDGAGYIVTANRLLQVHRHTCITSSSQPLAISKILREEAAGITVEDR